MADAPSEAAEVLDRPRPRAPVFTPGPDADPLDPDLLLAATQGEHGLALRNRICKLCVSNTLEHEACEKCRDVGPAGRVNIDIVGDDGRPVKQFDAMVMPECEKGVAMGVDGSLDLPPGPCTLRVVRFDGALAVYGDPVEVNIVEGEEVYQLLEVPAEPHGGIGVTFRPTAEGFEVEGLIAETAAKELGIEVGSYIREIDGVPVGDDMSMRDITDLLVGPAGTEIEVSFEGEDGTTTTHRIDRRQILGHQLGGIAGSPG